MQTVLTVSMRSWWSASMISKKVTWLKFPARISTVYTVYSTLIPNNELVFKFLIKVYIFASIKFLTEYLTRKYAQLCCINSATFFQFFHYFLLIWSFQGKSHFRSYLQSCKEIVDARFT